MTALHWTGHVEQARVFSVSSGTLIPEVSSTGEVPDARQYIFADAVRELTLWLVGGPHSINIEDLPTDSHYLKRPIDAAISYGDGEYLVEFEEAEIVTSGETAEEAIRWMKDTIVSLFDLYVAERPALGPLPRHQLSVLENYVGTKQVRAA